MLTLLDSLPSTADGRTFARTAGDEVQGLVETPEEAVTALRRFVREGGWRVGMGIGAVDLPVPDDVRAANGPAFIAARQAVAESRGAPQDFALVSDAIEPSQRHAAQDARVVLDLVATVWRRRSDAGWQVADLVAEGLSQQEVAARLGVTPSAVSQRARAAAIVEAAAGEALAVRSLSRAMAE